MKIRLVFKILTWLRLSFNISCWSDSSSGSSPYTNSARWTSRAPPPSPACHSRNTFHPHPFFVFFIFCGAFSGWVNTALVSVFNCARHWFKTFALFLHISSKPSFVGYHASVGCSISTRSIRGDFDTAPYSSWKRVFHLCGKRNTHIPTPNLSNCLVHFHFSLWGFFFFLSQLVVLWAPFGTGEGHIRGSPPIPMDHYPINSSFITFLNNKTTFYGTFHWMHFPISR